MSAVNITVYPAANGELKFTEGLPGDLGFSADVEHFSIRYPDYQVVVWMVGKLTGREAYNALQTAIRLVKKRIAGVS